MKVRLFFSLLLVFVHLNAQQVVENPDKPSNPKAGRILKLKEVLLIKEELGKFYFKSPGDVKIATEGSIYISDPYAANFLKFSPDGKFLKNLYKKGEGPGEISDYFGYSLLQNEIFIFDFVKSKVIIMDLEGNLVNEFKLEAGTYNDFMGVADNNLVFLNKVYPFERKTSKLYDIKNVIVLVSKDGKTKKEIHAFLNKTFLVALAQGGGGRSWDPFLSILDGENQRIFVCHSSEYMIEALDLNKGEMIKSFGRKYRRVDHVVEKWEEDFQKRFNTPKKKYEHDIEGLFINKDELWVKTSTEDKQKGFLIDVFDENGRYLDNFFIKINGTISTVHEDFLYAVETDENGIPSIVKYKIEDE
jgi:hypothetical protein